MIRKRLEEWADYFGAIALALWVATGILFLLKNQTNERLALLAGLGVVFFAVYLYFKFTTVREVVTSRSARYGSNALLISVLFIGIVGFVNFLGNRYVYRYDTTENKSFTLSPLTTQALQDLKEPVNVVAFYTTLADQTQARTTQDRLKEYKNVNPDKFNYKFVDPEAEPLVAADYNVQYDGTIVFERGKRRENVFQNDEQTLTNAVVKISQETQPTFYFTTGHGEHSLDDSGNNGYSMIKQNLEFNNYKTAIIDLKTLTDTVPSDATGLVIAGPASPFTPDEVNRLRDYLNAGGRAVFLLDTGTTTGLEGLLKEYGLIVHADQVYDPRFGLQGRPQIPVINNYKSHAVTQNMTGQSTLFFGARSMAADTNVISYTLTALFSSSDLSWGETDFDSIKNQTAKQDDKDLKGPLDLGYAIEGKGTKPARLVVLGDSVSLTNNILNQIGASGQQTLFGNMRLFFNTALWFAGQENLIQIPPKSTSSHQVILTTEQMNLLMLSSVIFIPGVILIIGILVWWRRR